MNIVGNKIKLKLFGTSHGKQVGCVIYGLPKGITLN
jgi:chorismate synthase